MAVAALFPLAGAGVCASVGGEARAQDAPNMPRFSQPGLDVLRLAAFLMVWLSHALLSFAGLLPPRPLTLVAGAGSCGVPVFFFLSAYLITELLRRERAATGTVHVGSFYMRRILRIWPLYFGVLAIYALLGLRFHGFRIEPGRLLAFSLLAGNWYMVAHPAITTPLRALWSISVEEQWYLLFPLLRRALGWRQILAVCAGIIIVAQLLLFALPRHGSQRMLHVTAWTNSGVQFEYLALGAAAALLLDGRLPSPARVWRLLLLFSAAAAFLLASGWCHIREPGVLHSASSLILGYALAGVGAAALFFSFLGMPASRCPAPLVRLGRLSFGLYVFHEAGFFLANAVARHAGLRVSVAEVCFEKLSALALTAGLAFASYYLWEKPFLRQKQRWTLVRSGLPA